MDDKRTITIAVVLSVAMVLMFIGVIIFVRVKKADLNQEASSSQEGKISSAATIQLDDEISYEAIDVSNKIVTIDDVADDEDIKEHSVEVEQTYINTTELLPSIWKQR
jgi:cell division protein FtsX